MNNTCATLAFREAKPLDLHSVFWNCLVDDKKSAPCAEVVFLFGDDIFFATFTLVSKSSSNWVGIA
jgi:hypothetical protein